MLEQISQLVLIIGALFTCFTWLISFLGKRFSSMEEKLGKELGKVEAKLEEKVSEKTCQERRSHLPCYTAAGGFKCPDQNLVKILTKLAEKLDAEED